MTEEILAGTVSPAEPNETPTADAVGEKKQPAKAPAAAPRLRLSDIKPLTQVKGVVKNIAQFGAFVDIGAEQDGLVHISELSENRVRRVEDVVKVGQEVEVTVLEVDANRRRISLSLKPRYDVYDAPADEYEEASLTPMQHAFARAQQKRDDQESIAKNREKVRQDQEALLSRTLRQLKDQK